MSTDGALPVNVKPPHYMHGQAQMGPGDWGSQISCQSAHEFGKVVNATHPPPLPPGNIPGTHLLEAEWTPGPECGRKDISHDTIGTRNRDLPACSTVPQPTLLLWPSDYQRYFPGTAADCAKRTENCAMMNRPLFIYSLHTAQSFLRSWPVFS